MLKYVRFMDIFYIEYLGYPGDLAVPTPGNVPR